MRETFSLFSQHYLKVESFDRNFGKYKPSIAPLELTPNELLFLQNPYKVLYYKSKVNLDLNVYLNRQEIFAEKLQQGQFCIEEDNLNNDNNSSSSSTLYYRVVKNKQEVYDVVNKSFLRRRDFTELPHGLNLRTTWNLLWTWSKPQIDMSKLLIWQKVNHFPFNKNIVRKDLLKKNVERIQKLGVKTNNLFKILPKTYALPKEYVNFSENFYRDMEREGNQNIWIIKPIGKSRGRGISLINDISQVIYSEPIVVQKYIKNPLLLRGFKFDMRIYVLVTLSQSIRSIYL